VIRAYIPWYLVRNYWVFAFIACLGALQLAAAYRAEPAYRRARYAVAFAILVGAFLGFYALAPELLTPGPAGGELTFLFGGIALLAVIVTRIASRWFLHHSEPGRGEESLSHKTETFRRDAAQGDTQHLKFRVLVWLKPDCAGIWYLIFGLSLAAMIFDVPLFHWLNSLALHTPLIDAPVQFLMNDYIVPTALVLTLLALWFAGRDADERAAFQRTVLRAMLTLALASITLKLINEVYFRPRPFTFDDSVRLLFYHPSDSSMPSNAATVSFALAVAVWLRQKRWGIMMLALSVGMTFARIVGGVHYPADVVVGAWLGGVWAWLVNRAPWLDSPLDVVSGLARRMGLG
jgi:undecaprenyl-diphosphatase